MRTFFLENELGQQFQLNNVTTGFLHNPKGLGYQMNASYTKLGTKWTRNSFEDTQATISGEVVFATDSPYEAAQPFFQFIRKSKNLTVHRTTSAGEFLRDVDLVNCEVGEIGEGNMLSIPVRFTAKSLWYSKKINRADITQVSGDITRYAYRFPSMFNPFSDGYVTINNDGSVESGFMLEFYGPCANPKCDVECDGETIGTVSLTGNAAAGEKIIYSSVDGELYAFSGTDAAVQNFFATGDTTGLTNLVPALSIANSNFFRLKVGENRIHVTADSPLTNPVVVTTFKYYRAV